MTQTVVSPPSRVPSEILRRMVPKIRLNPSESLVEIGGHQAGKEGDAVQIIVGIDQVLRVHHEHPDVPEPNRLLTKTGVTEEHAGLLATDKKRNRHTMRKLIKLRYSGQLARWLVIASLGALLFGCTKLAGP